MIKLRNGDAMQLVRGAEAGGIRMELARRGEDGKWKSGSKIGVEIAQRTIRAENWSPLRVLRWYKFILQDAITFGVPGRLMEVAQPTRLTPLGCPTTVLAAQNPDIRRKKAA